MALDAVLHDNGKVLVAAEMHGAAAAQFFQRGIATALRPGIAIEIREQAVVHASMQVHRAAEGGLREHTLHLRAAPVAAPLPQEIDLAFA